MSTAESQLLVISSKQRTADSTSSSDFYIQIQDSLREIYRSAEIEFLRLPNTVYTVTSGVNDQLVYTDQASAQHTVTITEGYYTTTTLCTEIAAQMQAVATGTNTYSVSHSTLTGLITISAASNFQLNLDNASNTFYEVIGFSPTNRTGAASYSSDRIVDLFPHSLCNIMTDLPLRYNTTFDNLTLTGVVATFPFNVASFEYLAQHVTNRPPVQHVLEPVRLNNRIRVRLVDDEGTQLDFQGVEWIVGIRLRR